MNSLQVFTHPRSLLLALFAAACVITGIPGTSLAKPSGPPPHEPSVVTQATHTWRPPLRGPLRIIRGFEPAATPWGRGHRGVDLSAPPGTAVRSAGPGVVVFARTLVNRGVVSVEHAPGVRTTYEPVRAVVEVGSSVSAGSLLGYLSTGGHQPGALHWGLRIRGSYTDPLRLLRGTSILKPVSTRIMRADEPA